MTQIQLLRMLRKLRLRYEQNACYSQDTIESACEGAKADFARDLIEMLETAEEDLFSFSELDEASHVDAFEARNVERLKADCTAHVDAYEIQLRATLETQAAYAMRVKFDNARQALQKAGKL